ncbi:MAG: sigma 54-interacting transcriptional regulator [Tissierellaceae bacterium]|nr:sigma 54-interacting transcriptional regulator [Tissierellaceae bacterium]
MKSIAIVTDNLMKSNQPNSVGHILRENLEEIFGDQVAIKNYYIDDLNDSILIEEDLVLAMASSRAFKIRNYVKDPKNIIVAQRTFLKSNVRQLFKIPENTDVLVVNDDIETVLNSVSSLYDIGVKHLNLIPFEFGKDYNHIKIAVSPSEPEMIPPYIKTFFDVGHRVLDISTILLIINILNINDRAIHVNLYNYYQKIFSTNIGIEENYNKLLTRTEILDHLLDLSNDGILLTSKDGEILIYNIKFREIFDIKKDIVGYNISETIDEINLKDHQEGNSQDGLISFNNRHITYEKKNISHFNNEYNMHFTFQEVTYIKKLEQNISNKLRLKGHIAKYNFENIVTQSPQMYNLIEMSKKASITDISILITGETGTGKEVFAQAIHNSSPRSNQPFVAVNCAAMPESLLESELFGYVSGSFTGALKGGKKGLFEIANHGTIFLDEIGDMPHHLQSKLVRVLQERQVMPIGSDKMINVDVRIISATNKDLTDMMEKGLFRKDLFYRLNAFPIDIPPLRNRVEDIPLLIGYFSGEADKLSEDCLNRLISYSWPGNIRELENVVTYLYTFSDNKTIGSCSLPEYIKNNLNVGSELAPGKTTSSPYEQEIAILEETTSLENTIAILGVIEHLNMIDKTAGRKHLLETLNRRSHYIRENHLKNVLSILRDLDFIEVETGRRGSYITDKGKSFLKYYN